MSDNGRLKVVLCWHMHQPEYRDLSTGEYRQPWTYLHAIKDYVDMAAHLEAVPSAKAVVNFVPILLEQIDDYAQQVAKHMETKEGIRDPLLQMLDKSVMPSDSEFRLHLIKNCLRVNRNTVINRFPQFKKLAKIADWLIKNPEGLSYVSEQYLVDMMVWYHLAWLGEFVRRNDLRVKRLMDKMSNFSAHDRQELMTVISELLSGLLDRYRVLAVRGQVELSMTPYAHPIAPLLLSIDSAKEAMPDVALPMLEQYPGGEERLRRHITHGIDVFEHYFGFKPKGCWPAEGSVSVKALEIFDDYGFLWAATGESVLKNTLHSKGCCDKGVECRGTHQAYQVKDQKIRCFFRDDGLSDLVGFNYSNWHADDAVANLVQHLENIAEHCKDLPGSVASIILDGENAWEYYPENGYYFLGALYKRLAEHPGIELTTYSEVVEQALPGGCLKGLVAGSWVYGTFSTWIGDADKNRGWDMLGDAKRCYDKVVASARLSEAQLTAAEQQLFICEGSDWFWWFGDYNPSDSVSDFEQMFRMHLAHLYALLGEDPPEYLLHVFTHGTGAPAMGGAMRPGQANS
jgi:alpha-amylase/alpha-mannosidase (GH57 family)